MAHGSLSLGHSSLTENLFLLASPLLSYGRGIGCFDADPAQRVGDLQLSGHHLRPSPFGRAVFAALGGVSAAFHVGFVEIDTMKNKLLALGVGGTILAALCCFTPILPVVLTALGLTGLLGVVYSDAFLLPILAGFLILTGYAIWRQKTQK